MKGRYWNESNKYFKMTREEIKQLWVDNGEVASQLGTKLHYDIELFMNQEITINDTNITQSDLINYYNLSSTNDAFYFENGCKKHKRIKINNLNETNDSYNNIIIHENHKIEKIENNSCEWDMFLNFINKKSDFVPYRTEWIVYDKELKLSGSIDMVYKNSDGTLDIYDWKRSKEIVKTCRYGKTAITDCIDYIPDTNYWHYTLQLNIYKRILEDNYNQKVKNLKLVILHPNNKYNDYCIINVSVMDETISDLYNFIKQNNKASQ
jgi:hypothetical protein